MQSPLEQPTVPAKEVAKLPLWSHPWWGDRSRTHVAAELESVTFQLADLQHNKPLCLDKVSTNLWSLQL
jgi:hypothetical protein